MTIRVQETQESRTRGAGYDANSNYCELEFAAWDDGFADVTDESIKTAVLATLGGVDYGDPLTWNGLRLQAINLRPVTKSLFFATARYGVFQPPAIDQVKFGFSTAGGTEHITHSLATIASYAATGFATAPNFGQAINVTRDGVHGTQRGVAQLSGWVTGFFDPSAWTATDWLNLADLSFTWNLSSWHGWPAKYALFEYAEASEIIPGTGDMVPVKFYFKFKRPELVAPAPGISFTKDPWDHVWHDYVPTTDNAARALAQKIRSTHREQLFVGSAFSLLGLGT